VSFDGITAGNTPPLVEVTYLTGASQVTPGTNNTAVTIVQEYGRILSASAMSAGRRARRSRRCRPASRAVT